MADTEEGAELTRKHKREQVQISALAHGAAYMQRDRIELDDITGSIARYIEPMTAIAAQASIASVQLAESYISAYTLAESGEVVKIPRAQLKIRQLQEQMQILANYGVKARIKLGLDPEEAWELGAKQAEAFLAQSVLNAGRSTISSSVLQYHGKRARFRRVTDGHPCAFCAMLAGRGPVYVSGENFRTHSHCGCTLEPVFQQWVPNEQEALWRAAYLDAVEDAQAEFGRQWSRKAAGEDNILYRMRRRNPHLFHDGVFPADSPVRSQAYHSTVNARRDRLRREQRFISPVGLSGGSGGKGTGGGKKRLPFETGVVPLWWNDETKAKILDGVEKVISPGIIEYKGGHRPGRGWPKKTEFDFTWSDEKALDAVMETWLSPEKYRLDGDRLTTRKIVDGSLIEVAAYGENYEKFRSAFPVGGKNVIINGENGPELKDIPEDWREEQKWKQA